MWKNEYVIKCSLQICLCALAHQYASNQQLKMAVRRVFCSYLHLLVNVKDDLAVALTLDVPSRSLGRQAFTDLKRAAHNGKTSLFLVIKPITFCFAFIVCFCFFWSFKKPKRHKLTLLFFLVMIVSVGCNIVREGHPAGWEGLRSSRVGPTEETRQRPVRLCPVSGQPRGNSGGGSRPVVHSTAYSTMCQNQFLFPLRC